MNTTVQTMTQQPISSLQILQKEFVILKLGGKHGVIKLDELDWCPGMKSAPSLIIYYGKDVQIALTRRLETLPFNSKPDQVIRDFWNSPSTKVYSRLAFSPNREPTDTLNLWIGETIIPKFGSWETIQLFLHSVICSSDNAAYEYLINFLAHMLQKPEEKPGVMIVLLGGEGIGKGTIEQILRKIFAATTLLVSDVDSVVGRFNACLERAYAVFMDEALFHGDMKSTERLKSFVTSQFIRIEEKIQPKRSIESFHRFFAASNSKHFAHVDYDNRRMFFLKVSEIYKDNREYWKNLYAAINGEEVAAMVDDLLSIDLKNFVVRDRPESKELLVQKIESLPPIEKFWFDALYRGEKSSVGHYGVNYEPWIIGSFWKTNKFLESFKLFSKLSQRYDSTTAQNVHDTLTKICPSIKKKRRSYSGDRAWGYDLPLIETARKEFEQYLGGTAIDWPELSEEDDLGRTEIDLPELMEEVDQDD